MGALVLTVVSLSVLLKAQGRIEGQVVNGTTSKPVAKQPVQLLMPRGGMQQVAVATTDASGRFVFPPGQADSSGFYLLQAVYQDVNYHAPVQFDSGGNARANVTVFDSTRTAPPLRIRSARVVVQAEGDKAHVQEMFAVQNSSNPPESYTNPLGTFRFRLSAGAGEPTVAVAGLMNMPLPQPASPGQSPGEFSIPYALKPGMTVVMVVYERDYNASGFTLGDSVSYPIDSVDLLVSPSRLAVDSSLFKPAGTDAETGRPKYAASDVKRGAALEARLSGEADSGAPSEAESSEAQVKVLPNPMTRLSVPLLACFLLLLLWALGVRMVKEWPRWVEQRQAGTVQKELAARVDALFNSLADLDELFAAGKIADKQYWKERLELKARLVATLKKAPPSLLESYATRNTPR